MEKSYYLAVRGICYDAKKRILMVKRSSACRHQPGFWEFPGGKMDPSESVSQTLKREFCEETGLTIRIKRLLGSGEWEREDYRIAYLFMEVESDQTEVRISREHDDFLWMTAEELSQAEVSPQLRPIRDTIISQLR